MGSFERFIGILIEHYAGEFPVWLAPVQAIVLPISDRHAEAARAVADELRGRGVRVDVDDRSESIGKRIRDAELQKIPYMLVVGDRESEEGTVAVRRHHEGDIGSVRRRPLHRARRARERHSCRSALDGVSWGLYFCLLTLTSAHTRA